jgi:hypothetical protein
MICLKLTDHPYKRSHLLQHLEIQGSSPSNAFFLIQVSNRNPDITVVAGGTTVNENHARLWRSISSRRPNYFPSYWVSWLTCSLHSFNRTRNGPSTSSWDLKLELRSDWLHIVKDNLWGRNTYALESSRLEGGIIRSWNFNLGLGKNHWNCSSAQQYTDQWIEQGGAHQAITSSDIRWVKCLLSDKDPFSVHRKILESANRIVQ